MNASIILNGFSLSIWTSKQEMRVESGLFPGNGSSKYEDRLKTLLRRAGNYN
jgi:hypothetical protein